MNSQLLTPVSSTKSQMHSPNIEEEDKRTQIKKLIEYLQSKSEPHENTELEIENKKYLTYKILFVFFLFLIFLGALYYIVISSLEFNVKILITIFIIFVLSILYCMLDCLISNIQKRKELEKCILMRYSFFK